MHFRRLLLEQMEKVECGEDPLGVIRDPARTYPMIEIPRERKAHYAGDFLGGSHRLDLRYVREDLRGGHGIGHRHPCSPRENDSRVSPPVVESLLARRANAVVSAGQRCWLKAS